MKFRKALALLLSAVMATSMTSFAASAATTDSSSASAGSYYNVSYLENYAQAAYDVKGLGAVYSPASTTFKTWSPDASSVSLKLYATGSDSESGAAVLGTYAMTKDTTTGVWSVKVDGDLKNVYYTYVVNVYGNVKETQDVYSKAVGVNGNRSMVVDLDSTDPEGWTNDKHVLFDNASDAVVWEVHVRDFSASDTSGVSKENQGKYLAFAEGGTKLNSSTDEDAVSTGIDYLVEQGINCVQLMPVYDFQSVDESTVSSSTNRNWGYDPQNYNVPEGSYSSNAYDGNTRITEFKQMIQALHDRGISVIMDVVYNHTYTTEGSCFSRTVPGYYYRMTSATTYSNGSGCGNETASDKLMYRKYMIESLKYWVEEYHIDGFRFDLMGIHDIPTMNLIREEIDNIYADGSGKKILMYGEPWSGGTVAITDGCSQPKASQLDERVGMFCDSYRDAIKGDTNGAGKGYVQGTTSKTATVVKGIKGQGFAAKAPSQTISYADAHDNLILWDKIVKSNSSSEWESTSEDFKAQMKEAMTLVLTAQGIPFMTAGTEHCRTKFGDHNSYKSSDSINAIDWTRIETYADIVAYYKGLLQIRKNYTAMSDGVFHTPTFQSSTGYAVAYTYDNDVEGEWGKVCVIVNSGTAEKEITLDGSGWVVVADGTKAGLESLGTVDGSTYTIAGRGTAVLVEAATFGNLKDTDVEYGTLTTNHVDENGNLLKTSTSKYEAGSTYRALPDATILFDNVLVNTEGATSGTVVGGENYTVTFTYKSTGVKSGYLTVEYVDTDGNNIKDGVSYHLRDGDSYEIPVAEIQGYQLDTYAYPAKSYGTFTGEDQTVKFVYEQLSGTSITVHYYNANNWSTVRCYAYTDGGAEPNGAWSNATKMKAEGDGWFKCTVPAGSAYVMFHNGGGVQEPGSGESGYPASGEVWIQNKAITFGSTVITSHIDLATGKKLVSDVVKTVDKTTSAATYTTYALEGRTDVIAPMNATGNYRAGIINVVYLYTSGEMPISNILIGDADMNGEVSVMDATLIQKHLVGMTEITGDALIAADATYETVVSVLDATAIQKYLAGLGDTGKVGQYYDINDKPNEIETQPVVTEPEVTEPEVTEPRPESYTLVLSNSQHWDGTIYCSTWATGEEPVAREMTFLTTNGYGESQYKITIPSNIDFIQFNNGQGGKKTIDIEFTGDEVNFWIQGDTDEFGAHYYGTW